MSEPLLKGSGGEAAPAQGRLEKGGEGQATSAAFLVGYRGSGKTVVGELLAQELGWELVDTDRVVEDGLGMSIAEYFAKRASRPSARGRPRRCAA